jgi:hypothetical protein
MGRFLALGSDIVPTPDQSYTDFQKAVMEITKREKVRNQTYLLLLLITYLLLLVPKKKV